MWKEIITSEGWKLLHSVLEEHVEYLNNQSLLMLDKKDFESANSYRIRAKEGEVILNIMEARLKEFKTTKKEDEDEW